MAVDALVRWETIRTIICDRKSGTLTLQMGRDYLHWSVQDGHLTSLYSTLPENSFTQFILNNRTFTEEDFHRARSQVSELSSFGAILLKLRLADVEEVRRLLHRYWCFLSDRLLQPSSHFFWSSRQIPQKTEFVAAKMPLGEVILQAERNSVDLRNAVRFSEKIPLPYRIRDWTAVAAGLNENEKRILHYLKRGCSLTEILQDAELDRVTCHRVLFLLWLSGHLQESHRPLLQAIRTQPNRFWDHLKSIPADWIFPLTAGALLGVLLVPPAKAPPKNPAVEQCKAPDSPAWSSPPVPSEEDQHE